MITCAKSHAELGAHRVTCADHEGWAVNPGECPGCLPRAAERGFLCYSCYDRVVNAVAAWSSFEAALHAAEGRLVSPEAGPKGTQPGGYANLTLTFLTIDECRTHLDSRAGRTVDVWVHDEAGARDALRFTAAAERAYRDLEVEEREREVVKVRCPGCGFIAPTGNITTEHRGATHVACAFCGLELATVRPDVHRWVGSATCEDRMHSECDNLDCRCTCHLLGAQSRPGGVGALWDADQHTVTSRRRVGRAKHQFRYPIAKKVEGRWRVTRWETGIERGDIRPSPEQYRADWTVSDALTIEHTDERKTA